MPITRESLPSLEESRQLTAKAGIAGPLDSEYHERYAQSVVAQILSEKGEASYTQAYRVSGLSGKKNGVASELWRKHPSIQRRVVELLHETEEARRDAARASLWLHRDLILETLGDLMGGCMQRIPLTDRRGNAVMLEDGTPAFKFADGPTAHKVLISAGTEIGMFSSHSTIEHKSDHWGGKSFDEAQKQLISDGEKLGLTVTLREDSGEVRDGPDAVPAPRVRTLQ